MFNNCEPTTLNYFQSHRKKYSNTNKNTGNVPQNRDWSRRNKEKLITRSSRTITADFSRSSLRAKRGQNIRLPLCSLSIKSGRLSGKLAILRIAWPDEFLLKVWRWKLLPAGVNIMAIDRQYWLEGKHRERGSFLLSLLACLVSCPEIKRLQSYHLQFEHKNEIVTRSIAIVRTTYPT